MSAYRMCAKLLFLSLLILPFSAKPAFAEVNRDREIYLIMLEEEQGLPKEKAYSESFREAQIKKMMEDAQEEYEKEKLPVKPVFKASPYANASITYDDNIYQLSDKTSDLYYKLAAGVNLFLGAEMEFMRELSLKRGYQFDEGRLGEIGVAGPSADLSLPTLKFDLGLSMTNYSKNSSLDQKPFSNFNNGFMPDVAFEYKLGRRKNKLRIKQIIHPDIEALSAIRVGAQGQLRYVSNQTQLDWEQTFNRLGYNLGYSRKATSYEDSNKSSDYSDQNFIFGGFIQAFPKTRFFVEGNYGTGEYVESSDNGNDVEYWKAYLGVQGKISKKISGVAKAGYQIRDYNSGDQLKAMAADITLDYNFSPKTKFSLKLSQDSRDGNYSADGFNKNTTAILSANYAFNRKLNADLGLISYMHDKYESGRRDKTFTSSIGLNYLFGKWMTMTLSLVRIERESNNPLAAFENNKCTLSAKLEF